MIQDFRFLTAMSKSIPLIAETSKKETSGSCRESSIASSILE